MPYGPGGVTPPAARGIERLDEVLARHPEVELCVYNRTSGRKQAGRGKARLREKTEAVIAQVVAVAGPGRVRHVELGVEKGYMTEPRRVLRKAAELARKERWALVAPDTSRFIRAGDYHRTENPNAWPTEDEFAELREVTGGVVLATVADPLLTEAERHSLATRRTGKAGRPPGEAWLQTEAILRELTTGCRYRSVGYEPEEEPDYWDGNGEGWVATERRPSFRQVAAMMGLNHLAVKRVWDAWKQYAAPLSAYRRARSEGRLDPGGRPAGSKRGSVPARKVPLPPPGSAGGPGPLPGPLVLP